jgi:hypothetical protein
MKKNMGTVDRSIRVLAAIVIGIFLLTGQISGTLGIVLGIVGVVFLLTSAISFCPLYTPFKISTRKQGTTK